MSTVRLKNGVRTDHATVEVKHSRASLERCDQVQERRATKQLLRRVTERCWPDSHVAAVVE